MEAIGVAIGVVGLFSTCIDALEKFDAYKSFSHESSQLVAIFEADKRRFYDWAHAVGISEERIEEQHHARLDDPKILYCVHLVLLSLRDTLGTAERTQVSIQEKTQQKGMLSRLDFSTKAVGNKAKPQVSPMAKLEWTFRQRGHFANQVDKFSQLVERLHNLVPPSQPDPAALSRRKTGLGETVPTSLEIEVQLVLKDIQESVEIKAVSLIDDWLGAVASDQQLDDCLEARLDGTCEWIYKHEMFQRWMQPSNNTDSRLLWINGGAGHGKTVLCASIIEHLRKVSSNSVAYFFSTAHTGSQRQPKDVIRTWLSQLSRQDPDVLYTIRGHIGGKEVKNRALQAQAWQILKDVASPQQFLVLDGLDEYDPTKDTRSSFLKDLKEKLKDTGIRVLIVSRDEVDIRDAIRDKKTSDGWEVFDCQISEANNKQDIAQFSQYVVNEKLPSQNLVLREDIAQQMADKCGGMFLWIEMHKDNLRDTKAPKKIKESVKKMPRGLPDTYKRNWEAIQSFPDEDDTTRAITILRWVVFASRPLTVLELADALTLEVDSDDEDEDVTLDHLPDPIDDKYINGEIKGLCGSLVKVGADGLQESAGSRTIVLIHFTVKEFLLAVLPIPHKLSGQGLRTPQDVHHIVLAEHCLRYLNELSVWQHSTATESKAVRPFVDYASRLWPDHYRPGMNSLLQIIQEFFDEDNPSFRKWREYFESNYVVTEEDAEDESYEPSSPLYYSALFGLLPELELLPDPDMRNEAIQRDLNRADGRFGTPLAVACLKGNMPAFKWLLSLGADINAQGGQSRSALNCAIQANNLDLVKQLITLGADPSIKDHKGRSPVYIATRKGFKEALELLLRHGNPEDVHTPNNYDWSPLNIAADGGHAEIVKRLLEEGAATDIDFPNYTGWKPINSASDSGHLEVVKILLERGADPNTSNNDGWSALNNACDNGHTEVVRLLLDAGADISTKSNGGWCPLNSAVESGHLETAQLLLDRGADIACRNNQNCTPLHIAARKGYSSVAQLLLERGADVAATDVNDWTALNKACDKGHTEVVQLLLENGLEELEVPSENRWSPLNSACESGHVEIVRILLEKGADYTTSNISGWSPLLHACGKGFLPIARLLLEKGADPNVTEDQGWSPLNKACDKGHLDIIKLLIESGADLGTSSANGWTPINSAAESGHFEVVRYLLDKDADVTATTETGWNCFMHACDGGFVDIVKLLLKNGADCKAQSKEGWSALNLACDKGHTEIVELLLDNKDGLSTINIGTVNDWIPLRSAVENNSLRIVQLLLENGADASIKNNTGWTALNRACDKGYIEIVKLLLNTPTGLATLGTLSDDGWSPINSAAESGHVDVVRLLLEYDKLPNNESANVGVPNNAGRTALNSACEKGHTEIVRLLLEEEGAGISHQDNGGWSPLNNACDHGFIEIIRMLLNTEEGLATISTPSNAKWTPLNSACDSGHVEVVQLLLDYGCQDLNTPNTGGRTPCNIACFKGHDKVVDLLLRLGADPDIPNDDGWNAANRACSQGFTDVVRVLLDHGVNFKVPARGGWTNFNLACYNGHLDVVQLLCERDYIDLTTPDDDVWLPLRSACRSNNAELVQYLLGKGAEVGSRDKNGQTSVHQAAKKGYDDILRLLLAADRESCATKDNMGRTPIFYAAMGGHVSLMEQLLAIDLVACDIDMKDMYGSTTISIALRNHQAKAVEVLFAAGRADLKNQDSFGRYFNWWSSTDQKDPDPLPQDLTLEIALELIKDPPPTSHLSTNDRDALAWCDICVMHVLDGAPSYRCSTCWMGGFVICVKCYDAGCRCRDSEHEVIFRPGEKGTKAEEEAEGEKEEEAKVESTDT